MGGRLTIFDQRPRRNKNGPNVPNGPNVQNGPNLSNGPNKQQQQQQEQQQQPNGPNRLSRNYLVKEFLESQMVALWSYLGMVLN